MLGRPKEEACEGLGRRGNHNLMSEREGLMDEVTYKQKTWRLWGNKPHRRLGKSIPGLGNNTCKVPGARACLVCSRHNKGAYVIRAMRLVGVGEESIRGEIEPWEVMRGRVLSRAWPPPPHPWLLQRIVLFVFIYILIGSLQQLWESRQQGGQLGARGGGGSTVDKGDSEGGARGTCWWPNTGTSDRAKLRTPKFCPEQTAVRWDRRACREHRLAENVGCLGFILWVVRNLIGVQVRDIK